MNEEQRRLASELRGKSSGEAADWLLQHYPAGGEAIILLEHIALRKTDYRRLAKRYLAGKTHAHDRAYRLFAQRLGLTDMIRILGSTTNREPRDGDLLAYHLSPLLKHAKNGEELQEAATFLDALVAR